jgi:hypothetical protein
MDKGTRADLEIILRKELLENHVQDILETKEEFQRFINEGRVAEI